MKSNVRVDKRFMVLTIVNDSEATYETLIKYSSIDAYKRNNNSFTFIVNGIQLQWNATDKEMADKVSKEVAKRIT